MLRPILTKLVKQSLLRFATLDRADETSRRALQGTVDDLDLPAPQHENGTVLESKDQTDALGESNQAVNDEDKRAQTLGPQEESAIRQPNEASISEKTYNTHKEKDDGKDVRSAPRFRPREAEEHIRVVFFLQSASTWSSWESIWEACLRHPSVTPQIVLTPLQHVYGSSLDFDDCKALLINKDIPFYSHEAYKLATFRPHVAFIQNPYDSTRPDYFSIEALTEAGVRIAYVPYGLDIGGGGANIRYQYDLPLHQMAWRIFARSHRHRRMFAKYCRSGCGHVVVTGHPKLDSYGRSSIAGLDIPQGKKAFLWTPHFSVGVEPQWSTFQLYSEAIFNFFHHRSDAHLIVRPHPFFFQAMKKNEIWDGQGEAEFRQRIQRSDNIILDESTDYRLAFAAADALLADAGSFLLEFLPTGKPILYLHHPEGYGLSEEGDVVRHYYRATKPSDVECFLTMVAHGDDPMSGQRAAALEEFLYKIDGQAGERICQHIVEAINCGDDGRPEISQGSAEHRKASEYWKAASSTYLAPTLYYDRQEYALLELLNGIGPIRRAADIGCGDGRFTELISRNAGQVAAVDISADLVRQARERFKVSNQNNTEFYVEDLQSWMPAGKFELVSCMGVTSSLCEDSEFIRLLDRIAAITRLSGWLIMKDSLSLVEAKQVSLEDGYTARYRNVDDYLRAIARRGFVCEREIPLASDPEKKLTNRLFLFRMDRACVES